VPERHQLLLAEGSAKDASIIVLGLSGAGLDVDFQRVETAVQMEMALLAKPWDFIIFGEHLPNFQWTAALAICRRNGLDIPFIMVSETPDADPGVQRIKAGVDEYLLKSDLARLPIAVRRELQAVQERRIRQDVEKKSRPLSSALQTGAVAVIGLALDGVVLGWDEGAEHLFGFSNSEIIGRSISDNFLGEGLGAIRTLAVRENARCFETLCFKKDGSLILVQAEPSFIEDLSGRIIGASLVVRSLMQRKNGRPSASVSFVGNAALIS
jgi:PAS domain S-box-containing protein